MASKAESKQFELLVARIEEAAAPRGALVTSPDRIVSLIRIEVISQWGKWGASGAGILSGSAIRKRFRTHMSV